MILLSLFFLFYIDEQNEQNMVYNIGDFDDDFYNDPTTGKKGSECSDDEKELKLLEYEIADLQYQLESLMQKRDQLQAKINNK